MILVVLLLRGLLTAGDFTGPQACEPCHQEIYRRQAASHHANALRPASAIAPLLRPLRERGGAALRYENDGSVVAIAELGGETARLQLVWAFGAGSQAYTLVGEAAGAYVEHRVSWYRARNGLSLTPGHDSRPSRDVQAALGNVQSPQTAYRCFNCHATNVRWDDAGGPDLRGMIAGVTCERCHGPGRQHVEKPARKTVFNAGRLRAAQQTQMCAECHRSPDAEFKSEMPELENPLSVRFAPVGLTASRCYQKSGGISCLACHSPHSDPLPSSSGAYTTVCVGCHARTKAHGSLVVGNCVTCHMRTSEAAANLRFTDHRIRIHLE